MSKRNLSGVNPVFSCRTSGKVSFCSRDQRFVLYTDGQLMVTRKAVAEQASQKKEEEAVSSNLFGSPKPFSVYKKSLEEALKEIKTDLVKEEGLNWPISDSRKTKQTGTKLNVSFSYGPVEFEDAPFVHSRQCFLRCPYRAIKKKKKTATNDKGKKRIRKPTIKRTNCEAEIRLYEYKVFTVNRVPEGASRTQRADAIAAVRESAEDTSAFELHTVAYQICRNHNHKLVSQRNAISSGSDIGVEPADVNKCCDYPASEDEDEGVENDEVGENRNKRKKKRDIDYKGDWRDVTNRLTSFINDPQFDMMDDDVRALFLKKISDTANEMATYIYKRN